MKILVFGKCGQVGWELQRTLMPIAELRFHDVDTADFTRPESLVPLIVDFEPDVIVNAAAYTAVDAAEDDEGKAYAVNAASVGVIARAAKEIDALMIHYSTDYVFGGEGEEPFTELSQTGPLNAYGRTKLAGEELIMESGCDHLIFRTSWVYASRGKNFVRTMLKLAETRDQLNIVDDQIGSPTSARLIAEVTAHCISRAQHDRRGEGFRYETLNLVTSGYTSWRGFAESIFDQWQEITGIDLDVRVSGIATSDYPTPAVRPLNSRLSIERLERRYDLRLPDWRYALRMCLEELADADAVVGES